MSAEMMLTVVSTVTGVAAAMVAWLEYLRRARRPERSRPDSQRPGMPSTEGGGETVSVLSAGRESPREDPPAGIGSGNVPLLDAPIGRLRKVHGRNALLELLTQRMSVPSGNYQVLAGMGGVGKTTAALALAELAVSLGRLSWWVSGESESTLLASMMTLAAELGAPPGQVAGAYSGSRNPADVLWQQLRQRSGWLLVIDNADTLEALRIGDSPVADGNGWLRPSTAGLVVVTSRISGRDGWGRYGETHHLQPLSEADGAQVLLDYAGTAGTGGDAARLSARLGGLPLALHQAGSYLASPFARDRSFSGYMESMARERPALPGMAAGEDPAVMGTWDTSLDSLARQGREQARALLQVLACFAPSVAIPPPLLDHAVLGGVCGGKGESSVRPGLEALLSVGLIDVQAAENHANSFAVTVHPLVAQASRINAGPEVAVTAAQLLEKATSKLRVDLPGDWPVWDSLIQHLREMLIIRPEVLGKRGMGLLTAAAARTCHAMIWTGSYGRSQALADEVLGYAAGLGNTREVLYLRYQQATAVAFQGRYAEAERRYRDLIPEQVAVLGPGDPDVAVARFDLAYVIVSQGRYAEGEAELRAVIPVMRAVLGADNRYTMQASTFLGVAVAKQGRYADAEEELSKALAIQAETLGEEHQHTLLTRTRLADLKTSQGSYAEAERMLEDILATRLRVFSPDYPFTLSTRRRLAKVIAHGDGNRWVAAESELGAVISDQARILGDDHPDALKSKFDLAKVLILQGRATEASGQLRRLVAEQSRILGEENPDTVATGKLLDRLL